MNRPRDKAIYQKPEDAWGLTVWKSPLSEEEIEKSLEAYDKFYEAAKKFFKNILQHHKNFIVLDIHSYNHHRKGPNAPFDSPLENPEIIIGTETNKNPEKWRNLINEVIETMHNYNYFGRHLDVRENVKFGGGHFAEWIHETFVPHACVLSIEFKKFFMDEWTGEADPKQLEELQKLLQNTIPVLEKHLKLLGKKDE
jgi:N-formylglutamate amidohydrolase